ncbi:MULTISPECIES: alpha/beta hydrolase [Mycobacteriaceae]|uniref:alpha/beta hydrolase n=1 Tax=Mycobacteriaceae TaxID=1762 RepID=UPI00080192BA|nr:MULTISPECIES: alpha/beta hydrolase [Mycobacteriaceae]MCK0175049.1 alpha/beta hydrolase [Mycolicibacterium sp. F2034L]OBB61322.1 lipase [Mycobacterium sp. 852013-51886_SCH5428379]
MSSSLPVGAPSAGPPAAHVDLAPRGKSRVRDAAVNGATRISLRVIPLLPDPVKRLLLGRRTVTVDGNTLDTTLQFLLSAQRAAGLGGLVSSPDVAAAREQLRITSAMMVAHIAVDVSELSIPGPAGAMRARLYRPYGSTEGLPLLVFYHGGGFVLGDLDTHDDLCRLISRDGKMAVLSVDYRLAPEHKAPAAAHDAYAAYRWAREHAADLGADVDRIAVGGDSAGGNLAAVVSQLTRDDGFPMPALQVLIYPVVDVCSDTRSKTLFADGYFLTKRDMNWFMDHYLDGAEVDSRDPIVSPLLAADLSGLPPALVLTGGFDPLRDEGNAYAEAMRAAGVPVDLRKEGTQVHAFANFFPLGGGSAAATAGMISAIRAHLSRS